MGKRKNKGKTKWGLVSFRALVPMVNVLEKNIEKYSYDGWKTAGYDKKEVEESMMRHLTAIMDGEETDPESGMHHIGHLMSNAMFYSELFVIKK